MMFSAGPLHSARYVQLYVTQNFTSSHQHYGEDVMLVANCSTLLVSLWNAHVLRMRIHHFQWHMIPKSVKIHGIREISAILPPVQNAHPGNSSKLFIRQEGVVQQFMNVTRGIPMWNIYQHSWLRNYQRQSCFPKPLTVWKALQNACHSKRGSIMCWWLLASWWLAH